MTPQIHYRAGLKYQLEEPVVVQTPIVPPSVIATQWITLAPDGMLYIRSGYAWDGASGPAIDTEDFMRASAVHDALYELIRIGALSPDCREPADALLRDLCIEDGMPKWRAWYTYWAVRCFGGKHCRTVARRP